MSSEIEQVTLAVTAINKVESGLAALRSQYAGVIFEVTTTAGMEAAREARRAVKEPRLEVERIRKAAKAPLLALGKRLDSEAARITAELEKIEAPIDQVIKAEEARKEAEREARVQAEIKRVADLQARIAELRGNQTLSPSSGSRLISEHIADLEAIPVDATFEEFEPQAADAKIAGLARLTGILAAAIAHEAAQEQLRKDQEELARLRAEAAERDRVAKEDQAKADAEAKAERARLEAIAKAERDAEAKKIADERAAQVAEARRHAQELEAQRLENERIARERQAEIDKREAEVLAAQAAESARLAAERAKLEADQAKRKPKKRVEAPTKEAIITVVATVLSLSNADAVRVLSLYDWRAEVAA